MASPRRGRAHGPATIKLSTDELKSSIARAQKKKPALVVIQGSESDIGTHVILDKTVTLGRDPAVELPLLDDGISRRHCRVVVEDQQFFVEDLKSTNGTLVNGAPLSGRALLSAGDRIYLGACVVKFTDSDALEVGYHAQMDALVGYDDLTGLIAKRRFDAAYVRSLDAARARRKPLSVMMLDMDGLKQINDTHGHPVGGYAIAEVGKIIGGVISSAQGAACRFGGDEFAAFLPGVEKDDGIGLGEDIRTRINKHKFVVSGVVLKPTISIGVAAFPDDGRAPEVLLRKADEALYRAKNTGRDRVRS